MLSLCTSAVEWLPPLDEYTNLQHLQLGMDTDGGTHYAMLVTGYRLHTRYRSRYLPAIRIDSGGDRERTQLYMETLG